LRYPTIGVNQRAIASARMSSRAFSSLGMKEHENGFVPLKRRNQPAQGSGKNIG
jgi:hypothetical protein